MNALCRSCSESDGAERRSFAMTKNVALITWAGLPEGAESERLLVPHLKARGVEARMIAWRDA